MVPSSCKFFTKCKFNALFGYGTDGNLHLNREMVFW